MDEQKYFIDSLISKLLKTGEMFYIIWLITLTVSVVGVLLQLR